MGLNALLQQCPHLASPAALARADTNGKFLLPRHLAVLNEELMAVPFVPECRLMANMPFQHGKSWLCSHYFPAWHLLLFPDTRIILATYSDEYAGGFGGKVKEVIEAWGGPHGVVLRRDSKAKNEWKIRGHEGGMVCKGLSGGVTGRPADLLIIDDAIKDDEEAMSPTVMERHWNWFQTVAFSRLGPTAGIVVVGTRWGTRDLSGRILEEAKQTGEKWKHLKFKAIAGDDDLLGRRPGEALWPERVPLRRLEMIRESRGVWFDICWQQEPQSEAGGHFRPQGWPRYEDLGEFWSVPSPGGSRVILRKDEAAVYVTVDWAMSEKKGADYTAMGVWALAGDHLLLLEVLNRRLRPEASVPALATLCERWRPAFVGVEVGGFQASLADDCRRFPSIPEVRRLIPENKPHAKLRRALPAILKGQNGRIVLPHHSALTAMREAGYGWDLAAYCVQLELFTGLDDAHDDMVDVTSWACQLAQQLRPQLATHQADMGGPCVLTPGREGGFFF